MIKKLPDQTVMWDKKHAAGDHAALRGKPSPLAEITKDYLLNHSRILELGCGVGRDAVFFASLGHEITATDSSRVVIEQNKSFYAHNENIHFEVLDIQNDFPYEVPGFTAVFANLSLHYFFDNETEEIFHKILRVLYTGGIFAFTCKSQDDYRTEDALEIAPNVYVAPNGHALHLFSKDFARQLLGDFYEILYLDEVSEEYQGRVSDIVRCIARKK